MTPLRFRARTATGETWIGSLDEVLRHDQSVPTWVYEFPEIKKDRSTGFNDQHGKEIFENDVVRVPREWETGLPKHFVNAQVVCGRYDDGEQYGDHEHFGWIVRYRIGDYVSRMTLPDAAEDAEVIGNVHANPELLNSPLSPSHP